MRPHFNSSTHHFCEPVDISVTAAFDVNRWSVSGRQFGLKCHRGDETGVLAAPTAVDNEEDVVCAAASCAILKKRRLELHSISTPASLSSAEMDTVERAMSRSDAFRVVLTVTVIDVSTGNSKRITVSGVKPSSWATVAAVDVQELCWAAISSIEGEQREWSGVFPGRARLVHRGRDLLRGNASSYEDQGDVPLNVEGAKLHYCCLRQ